MRSKKQSQRRPEVSSCWYKTVCPLGNLTFSNGRFVNDAIDSLAQECRLRQLSLALIPNPC